MQFRVYVTCLCLVASSLFGAPDIEQVIILGSGPAGLTAAIYTAKAGLPTLIIEGNKPGGQMVFASLIDNFPGFPQGISGQELYRNMREQAIQFGARIRRGEILEADLSKQPFAIKLRNGEVLLTQSLIIATGTSPQPLGIESEKALIGKGVSFCPFCDGPLFKGKEVVVVGDGNRALEKAIFLSLYASKVTVIASGDQLNADPSLQDRALENRKIAFLWSRKVEEICEPASNKVTGVVLRDLKNNQTQFYACAGVFISIGDRPNTAWIQNQLELDAEGYIALVPFTTKTSISGVFAAGSVTSAHYQQVSTAVGSGAMAGIDVCLHNR